MVGRLWARVGGAQLASDHTAAAQHAAAAAAAAAALTALLTLHPQPPHEQILWLVAHQKWRPPVPEGCPPALASLMQRCWQDDPRARWGGRARRQGVAACMPEL